MTANHNRNEPYDALQRTSLAWVRTALGLVVASLLAVRLAVVEGQFIIALVAGGCGVAATGLAVLQTQRRRMPVASETLAVLATAASVAGVGISAFVLILLAT